MKVFNLPDLGEGLPDAEIVRWLVKEGDSVELDQPMVEMETAKAVVEVPSPFSGKITQLCGQPGDVIEVGHVLVEFDGVAREVPVEAPLEMTQEQAQEESNIHAESLQAKGSQEVEQTKDTFNLPDLGEGLPDAEIVRWLVEEGDSVKLDQPMVEMETAKAVVEVPSPMTAIIAKLHGKAGDVIEVGNPLVSFGEVSSIKGSASAEKLPQEKDTQPSKSDSDAATVVGAVQVGNHVVTESADAVVKALARKLKVDLTQVIGSGKNGQITQADVKQAKLDGKVIVKMSAQEKLAQQQFSSDAVADKNPLSYKASPAVRAHARRLGVSLSACIATGKKQTITKADVDKAMTSSSASVAKPNAKKRPKL
jgi:pyruvate dehydrogenase E2 component (dihydrolipoamide acetyltransferase)